MCTADLVLGSLRYKLLLSSRGQCWASDRIQTDRKRQRGEKKTSFCVVCTSVITLFELHAFTRARGFCSCMHRYQSDRCALEKRPSFAPVRAAPGLWVFRCSDVGSTAQDQLHAPHAVKSVRLLRRMKSRAWLSQKNVSVSVTLLLHFCFTTQKQLQT